MPTCKCKPKFFIQPVSYHGESEKQRDSNGIEKEGSEGPRIEKEG
jgi:hypothetical protein